MKKFSVVLLLLVSVCARANEDFPEMNDKNGYVEINRVRMFDVSHFYTDPK